MAKINKEITASPHYILDENRNIKVVYDLMEWANWYETAKRHVRLNRLKKYGIKVSTIFLGIDHNFLTFQDGYHTPILFETMVFLKEDLFYEDHLNGFQERYCTWKEAVEGHHRVMRNVIEIIREKENGKRRPKPPSK